MTGLVELDDTPVGSSPEPSPKPNFPFQIAVLKFFTLQLSVIFAPVNPALRQLVTGNPGNRRLATGNPFPAPYFNG